MEQDEKDSILSEIKGMAHEYARTIAGSWMNGIDIDAVSVELVEMRGDVVGKAMHGCILLRECLVPSLLFGTYIHELRHIWQWKKHPIQYIIGKIIRPLIERDAEEQEWLADRWLDMQDK